MEFKLLNKKCKGIFINFGKYGIYCYCHFPKRTYRLSFSNNRIIFDSYSTIGFNKIREIELENE